MFYINRRKRHKHQKPQAEMATGQETSSREMELVGPSASYLTPTLQNEYVPECDTESGMYMEVL